MGCLISIYPILLGYFIITADDNSNYWYLCFKPWVVINNIPQSLNLVHPLDPPPPYNDDINFNYNSAGSDIIEKVKI